MPSACLPIHVFHSNRIFAKRYSSVPERSGQICKELDPCLFLTIMQYFGGAVHSEERKIKGYVSYYTCVVASNLQN
jgi:hypothetical protein